MAAGVGGDRPYTPKEPDPDEFDVESLFNEFMNSQRRKQYIKKLIFLIGHIGYTDLDKDN